MELSVFYSWQNDRPVKFCRYLIRDAAKKAIRQINNEAILEPSPRLDHDTKDIPGTSEIAATIFQKIKSCHFFLADVTFVGYTDDHDKLIPNPNVLTELGFAASSVGWERIICVMNTTYGEQDKQIFNIRHRRFPFTYKLLDDESIKDVSNTLAGNLKDAFESVIWYEHEQTKEIINRLDAYCLIFLHQNAKNNRIVQPPTNQITIGAPAGQLDTNGFNRAITRLLELGLIKTIIEASRVYYEWTYLGILTLQKLELRGVKN